MVKESVANYKSMSDVQATIETLPKYSEVYNTMWFTVNYKNH